LKLLHGDCLDLMSDIPDKSVDMVMADPPYGTTACKWDSVIPLEPMWGHLKRVIKKNGAIVMTASQPFTTTLIASNMKMFKYCWVWDKISCSGQPFVKRQPLRAYEDICVFYTGQCTYYPILRDKPKNAIRNNNIAVTNRSQTQPMKKNYLRNDGRNIPTDKSFPTNVIRINNYGKAYRRFHPTEKPVALFEYLIRTYTNEGDTVLDFTMGSGTTGVACVNLNRSFIGIELDPEYFAIAEKRIHGKEHLLC